jgi:hypothetical protein
MVETRGLEKTFSFDSVLFHHIRKNLNIQRFFAVSIRLNSPHFVLKNKNLQKFGADSGLDSFDFIKNGYRSFFFARIKVRVGAPCFLHVAVPESASYLLDVDALVDKDGCVSMPEFVDRDVR